jgi:phage protein D
MAQGFSIQFNGSANPELGNPAAVEVHECAGQPASFRLNYAIDIQQRDLPLLKEKNLSAGSEITVLVPVNSGFAALVKGPVRGQQIHLEHGGEASVLDVFGGDSTLAMDREDKAHVWADVSDSQVVSTILQQHGFQTLDVQDTSTVHSESKHSLVQRGTDLSLVRRLAARNGFLFWVTCDAGSGTETAYFKRPPLDSPPATELIINLTNPPANLSALDISWDAEGPASAEAAQLDLNTGGDIDGAVSASPLTALASTRFAAIGASPRTQHLSVPVDDAGDLQARGEGALIDSGWFIRARGQTTARALGGVLRAHTVVKLRGAGTRHSGKWFCRSVRHYLDAAEHQMDFELVRNGWEES